MREMGWQVDEEVNRDKTGEADEVNLEVAVMPIFGRGPPNGGVQCRWGMKNRDFDQYLAVSLKMIPRREGRGLKPFPVILSDLEWLSEMFSDTKHRAVSLRQLSFLSTQRK